MRLQHARLNVAEWMCDQIRCDVADREVEEQRTDKQRHADIDVEDAREQRPESAGRHASEHRSDKNQKRRTGQQDRDQRRHETTGHKLALAADVEQAGAERQHDRQRHADD